MGLSMLCGRAALLACLPRAEGKGGEADLERGSPGL